MLYKCHFLFCLAENQILHTLFSILSWFSICIFISTGFVLRHRILCHPRKSEKTSINMQNLGSTSTSGTAVRANALSLSLSHSIISPLSLTHSLTHSHTPDGSVWVQDARWRVEHLGIRHDSRSLFQIHRLLYVLILISTNVPSNVADPARPIQFSPTEAFQVLAGLCHTGEEEMKENTHTQDNGNCYRGIHYA